MAASAITDLLATQGEELARLQDADAATVLRIAQAARRELREGYEALVASGGAQATPYTAQQMRIMLAQSERAVLTLRQRLDETLTTKAKLAGEKALRDLLQVLRAREPDFKDAGNRVELRALARLSRDQGLLLHRYSLDRYSAELMDAIQRELGVGLMRGQTIPEITRRIAGADRSVFTGRLHRAELIARMEINGAYNTQHLAVMEEAAAELDDPDDVDPLMRRIDEYFDARNNPFSRAAEGTVATLKEPFRVPASKVAAAAAQLGKRVSGVVWPLEGAHYVGMNLPAHFNERGRTVPWRASWEPGWVAPVQVSVPAWVPPAVDPAVYNEGAVAAAAAHQAYLQKKAVAAAYAAQAAVGAEAGDLQLQFVAKLIADQAKKAKAEAAKAKRAAAKAAKAAALAAAKALAEAEAKAAAEAAAKARKSDAENILAEKVGDAKGSNAGGFYRGLDGKLRYVKFYADAAQAAGEHLANQLYADLGLEAPKSQLFTDAQGRVVYASEIVPGTRTLAEAGLTAARAREILKGFAADVLTANWDAVGTGHDNALITAEGKVLRVDNGGSFLFRAKAGRKPGQFLNQITEWDKFTEAHTNPAYAKVFKAAGVGSAIDIDSIEKQVEAIAALRKRAGGWEAYVERVIGGRVTGADRTAIVGMLEARSSKLTAALEAARAAKEARTRAEEARRKAELEAIEAARKALAHLPPAELALLKRSYASYETASAAHDFIALLQAAHPVNAPGFLTPAQRSAISHYTGSGYRATNGRLREGGALNDSDRALNTALKRGTLLQDMVVWRGVGGHKDLHEATPPPPGRIYVEKGFTSTAISKDKAFRGDYLFKIMVPKGTPALYVDSVSSVSGEKEAILPSGSKFRVLAVRPPNPSDPAESGRVHVVEMLLLPPGDD